MTFNDLELLLKVKKLSLNKRLIHMADASA
jgi:hypothetical protein